MADPPEDADADFAIERIVDAELDAVAATDRANALLYVAVPALLAEIARAIARI